MFPHPIVQRRLECAAVLAGALYAYQTMDYSWGLFVALFFLPDLSILAYIRGPRLGGTIYNYAHCFAGPLAAGLWVAVSRYNGTSHRSHLACPRGL